MKNLIESAANEHFPQLANEKQRKFLAIYVEASGDVTTAAKIAGIGRHSHYYWLKTDPEYKEAFGEAKEQAADKLEASIIKRAERGDREPVRYQGKIVGYVRRKSDLLAMFMLKGLRPHKFRDNYSPNINFGIAAGGSVKLQFNIPRPEGEGANNQVIDVATDD